MKGRVIIILLLLILCAWHGQSSALVFGEGGGVPERVKKRGLRVSCFVLCKGESPESLVEKLDKWIRIYLQGKLKDLKFVDEKKVTNEVLTTIPHLVITFKEINGLIQVLANLWGYDVIVERIQGRYEFWWSQNERFDSSCDLNEFRELVRPILDEFIYQYLTGR